VNPDVRRHLVLSLGLAAAGAVTLRWRLPGMGWLTAWVLAVNVVAFLWFCLDKLLSRGGRRRVPEAVLHLLALAGGVVGAFLGMAVARHKTAKRSFRTTLFTLLLLEAALLAAWLLDAFAGVGLRSPWA